jgi:hypothetical protein
MSGFEFSGAEFDAQIQHLGRLEQARLAADRLTTEAYLADPVRHAYAAQEGRAYAQTVTQELQSDDIVSPQASGTLESALTQLIFTFTDHNDYDKTLGEGFLAELIAEAWTQQEENASLSVLANHLSLLAAHLVVVKWDLDRKGGTPGLFGDDQLVYARNVLEEMIFSSDETDETE